MSERKPMVEALAAAPLVAGAADGPILALREPLSLWGGVDVETGRVVEARHPDEGACITGTILVLPAARGSSSSSSILAELLRTGKGPRGIVLGERDEILAVGSVVARELYGAVCPVLLVESDDIAVVSGWTSMRVDPDGTLTRADDRAGISTVG